jgi:DNA-binding transcriptional MerR regulator
MAENEPQDPDIPILAKYRIGTVSRLTGLSADVIRVWERRYEAISPQRSTGGSRLYSDEDIARLRKLRQVVEMGHAIGQIANLPEDELKRLSVKHQTEAAATPEADPYENVRHRFLDAISRHDVSGADEEIHRAAMLSPARSVVKNVISPLLNEIDGRKALHDFDLAQVNIANHLIRNLISSMFRFFSHDEAAETIVFATNVGERRELELMIGALIAATRGWRVVYLGVDVPAREIVSAVKQTKARILALSIVNSDVVNGEELRTIEQDIPSTARVWVGGPEAIRYRERIGLSNWVTVRDFDDLDDRLKR